MKRRIQAILLCASLLFSMVAFAACGSEASTPPDTSAGTAGTETAGEAGDTTAAAGEDTTTAAPAEPAETEYVYKPSADNKYTGAMGVGVYSTACAYNYVKIVNNEDKHVLYETDFSDGKLDGWSFKNMGGNWDASKTDMWAITDKGLTFSDTATNNAAAIYGGEDWGNINITVKGQAIEGIEGIRVYFCVKDEKNFSVFNCGGWNNTVATVETFVDGVSTTTDKIPFKATYGQVYTVSVNVKADVVTGFIDGEQIFQIGGNQVTDGFKGMCGFSTWSTEAYYDNIKVVDFYSGAVLYENDFSTEEKCAEMLHDLAPYSGGSYTGDPSVWVFEDGMLHQTNSSLTAVMSYFGDANWTGYIYTLDVMPVNGAEGSTIIGAIDPTVPSYTLFNCGGWSNTKGCWQTYEAGTTNSYDGDALEATLTYDEWSTLSLVVMPYAIFSYINGVFYQAMWY